MRPTFGAIGATVGRWKLATVTGPPTAQDRSGALLRRMGLSNACGLPEGGIKREYAAGVVLKLRSRGSRRTPYAHFNVFNVPPHRADDSFAFID